MRIKTTKNAKYSKKDDVCKGLHVIFRELREAHDRTTARWPAAPWMLARAFAKHVKGQHVS